VGEGGDDGEVEKLKTRTWKCLGERGVVDDPLAVVQQWRCRYNL
jgi:hypothetical protein